MLAHLQPAGVCPDLVLDGEDQDEGLMMMLTVRVDKHPIALARLQSADGAQRNPSQHGGTVQIVIKRSIA